MPASNYILESCAKTPKTIYTPIHPTPPPQNQSTPPPEVPLKAITEAFLHQSHVWNFSVLLNKSVCVCVTVFRATDK